MTSLKGAFIWLVFNVFLISLHQDLGISFLSGKSCMLDRSCLRLSVFRDCLKLKKWVWGRIAILLWICNQIFSGKIFMFKTFRYLSLWGYGVCMSGQPADPQRWWPMCVSFGLLFTWSHDSFLSFLLKFCGVSQKKEMNLGWEEKAIQFACKWNLVWFSSRHNHLFHVLPSSLSILKQCLPLKEKLSGYHYLNMKVDMWTGSSNLSPHGFQHLICFRGFTVSYNFSIQSFI